MIDAKQAIQRAKEYAVQYLQVDPQEMLLEEIRALGDHWIITLSFPARGAGGFHPLAGAMAPVRQRYDYRELKSFNVSQTTGEVEGMFNVQPI